MKIPEQQIKLFIELYHYKYGVVLEFQEAMEIATRFASFIELIESHSRGEV